MFAADFQRHNTRPGTSHRGAVSGHVAEASTTFHSQSLNVRDRAVNILTWYVAADIFGRSQCQ